MSKRDTGLKNEIPDEPPCYVLLSTLGFPLLYSLCKKEIKSIFIFYIIDVYCLLKYTAFSKNL